MFKVGDRVRCIIPNTLNSGEHIKRLSTEKLYQVSEYHLKDSGNYLKLSGIDYYYTTSRFELVSGEFIKPEWSQLMNWKYNNVK